MRTAAEAIERAREWWDRATPEEVAAMLKAQRESFIRAFAPCEHGDPDWETCPHCLAQGMPAMPETEQFAESAKCSGSAPKEGQPGPEGDAPDTSLHFPHKSPGSSLN